MFEPQTLTLAELAERWQRTPRQILEFAQHMGIPLYFNFAGLAFDLEDKWHRFSGDQWLQEELRHLTKSITANEELIARARDGQLSQWEHLPAGGALQLRAEINAMREKQKTIDARLAQREEERNLCTCAYLRAGPGTLKLIADSGDVVFPRWAFHPETTITAHQVRDERGNLRLEWSGRIMCLEPRSDDDPTWRKRLTADDLFASMAEAKVVEAETGWQASPTAPAATPQPAPTTDQSAPAIFDDQGNIDGTPNSDASEPSVEWGDTPWVLRKPGRYQGYARPLYEVLKAAHDAGKDMPSARGVLDLWRQKRPPEVMEVLADGIKYYDANGNGKPADVRAIQKAVDRLARLSPDSPD